MENKQKFDILDDEESKIVDMIENNQFIANEETTQFWQQAVKDTIKKKSVHLKLQERDVQKIRTIAYKKGIPYQTLIGSIIHQYAQNA